MLTWVCWEIDCRWCQSVLRKKIVLSTFWSFRTFFMSPVIINNILNDTVMPVKFWFPQFHFLQSGTNDKIYRKTDSKICKPNKNFNHNTLHSPLLVQKSNISVSWPTIIEVKNIECQLDDEKWDTFYKVHPNKTQTVHLNDTSKWFRSLITKMQFSWKISCFTHKYGMYSLLLIEASPFVFSFQWQYCLFHRGLPWKCPDLHGKYLWWYSI